MSLETSIEVLAGALSAHAEALKTLAAAIQAAPLAANCENFEAKRLAAAKSAAEKEAEALAKEAPKKAPNKAAKTSKSQEATSAPAKEESAPEMQETTAAANNVAEAVKNWEAGGGAAIEAGIPLKPGEDPNESPFEAGPEERPAETKAEQEVTPEAERGDEPKKAWQAEDARRLAIHLLKKVPNGETLLRGLLDDIGVKKLKALNAEQINEFCENASKFAAEA